MAVQETWTTLKILAWTKDFLLSKGVANARPKRNGSCAPLQGLIGLVCTCSTTSL